MCSALLEETVVTPAGWPASANTEDELIAKVTEHVKRKHYVQVMASTMANWVRSNQSGN